MSETFHELLIWLPGRGGLRTLIKAPSVEEAVARARVKYKNCSVEVPEPAQKVELVKSNNYNRPAVREQRMRLR